MAVEINYGAMKVPSGDGDRTIFLSSEQKSILVQPWAANPLEVHLTPDGGFYYQGGAKISNIALTLTDGDLWFRPDSELENIRKGQQSRLP